MRSIVRFALTVLTLLTVLHLVQAVRTRAAATRGAAASCAAR